MGTTRLESGQDIVGERGPESVGRDVHILYTNHEDYSRLFQIIPSYVALHAILHAISPSSGSRPVNRGKNNARFTAPPCTKRGYGRKNIYSLISELRFVTHVRPNSMSCSASKVRALSPPKYTLSLRPVPSNMPYKIPSIFTPETNSHLTLIRNELELLVRRKPSHLRPFKHETF